MLKKGMVLIIALGIAAVLLSGCGKEQNMNGDAAQKPTIRYMVPSDPGLNFTADTWSIKTWAENTGVNLEIISPPRDTFKEKLTATLASNNLPDLINYFQDAGTEIYKTYGSRLFVPLNEYIDKGKLPNLKSWLDKYPDIREKITSVDDGNIYGFPMILDYEAFPSLWTVRNDLLNKAGWDVEDIKTLEDLKAALLALKSVCGEEYITSYRNGWNMFAIQTAHFFGTAPGIMFDNKRSAGTNQYVYAPLTEQYKHWVEFYKWMYDSKLMHPNFATMQEQELFAGYIDGKFTLCMEQAAMGYKLGGNNDNYPGRDEKAIFPVSINGEVPKQASLYHSNNGYRYPVTVTKTSKVVDACIAAMDWLYSPEGYHLLSRGKEGEQWEYDDAYVDGYKASFVRSATTSRMVERGELDQKAFDTLPTLAELGIASPWIVPVETYYIRFSLRDRRKDEAEKAYFTINNIKRWIDSGNVVAPDPIINFTSDEKLKISEILTPLETYVSEQTIKFIIGQKPMDEWTRFHDEIQKMNAQGLADIYNSKLQGIGR